MKQENIVKLPKVTIVIPVYNGEKYVKFAIDSALSQTYKNLEILVVNDGSTDNTEAILKTYGKKIRCIKKANGGVSSALNLAIEKMTGEYFSWLSHDDTYEPNKIECEINFLNKNHFLNKKVIVFSDYNLINKDGKLIGAAKKNHYELEIKPEYGLLKGHINGLSLLIPKTAFAEYGGFDTALSCAQDYAKWWEMMKTYKFVHIPEVLVNTRYHKKQTTHTSPKVLTEGNAFYSRMLSEISPKRMAQLEGSEYNFFVEMSRWHQNGVYTQFSQECQKRADEIFTKASAKINEKKVSVIIPFFNREKETKRAINTVLNQTFKKLEIILVNDGSSEPIDEIIELTHEHDCIKLINNKKNLGASASRNVGIKAASGDYIVFLDSDDEFVVDKLEKQLQYAVASNAKILHTSYIRDLDGKKTTVHSGKQNGHCELELMYSCTIATPTVMLDRKWIQDKGVLFNTNLSIGEDTCYWLELMKGNTYLLGIDEPLSIVHANNNSAAYSKEKQVEGLKTIIRYLINDTFYSQHDFELSLLMLAYAHCAEENLEKSDALQHIGDNVFQKTLFFLKQEGFKSTAFRIGKKIKKIISSTSSH